MEQFMEQHNTWMPGYEAAIDRTMEGDFAFISDRPILDYVSRQKEYCGKMKVTGGWGVLAYTKADALVPLSFGSPFRALSHDVRHPC